MSKLLHILQHSLGVDHYGRGDQYRNHFVTGPGSVDWDTCQQAVMDGLMSVRSSALLPSDGRCFHVTEAGKAYVAEQSPKPPSLSRSQRRYREWLDADCCMPFGQYLRTQYGRQNSGEPSSHE